MAGAKAAKAKLAKFAKFCRKLKLPTGKWMRLEPFQGVMLLDYFAGVRELVIVIPKKNGKTTLLAALALYHLMEEVENADCVVVANSSLQAMKLFDEAKGFVDRNPELKAKVRVLRGYREIRLRDPDDPDNPKAFIGTIKVLAADEDTADGWGGTLALVDELHRAKDAGLYGVLSDGLDPRDGQLVTISTAGENEDSPLGDMRRSAYALKVKRDGAHRYIVDEGFAWHEWALEPTDDTEDLKLVKTANPASWQTLTKLRLRRKSKGMTAHRWARFACGIWGQGGEPYFEREKWDALAVEKGAGIEAGRAVTLGFDGARRKDDVGIIATDIETGRQVVVGHWKRPADADENYEHPLHEISERIDYAFERWDVWRLYGDPPYFETQMDEWAGKYGSDKVVRWWTNRNKAMALALRAYKNDMRPGVMEHDGDEDLARHIRNCIRVDTRMRDESDPEDPILALVRKASRDSPNKIDLAVAATLSWEARGDAIASGVGNEPEYERAAF